MNAETGLELRDSIEPRNLHFAFDKSLPAYWHGGNPVISSYYDALSLTFPEGERFFIDSVKNYAREIQDPALKRNVRAFTTQEAIHSREHDAYNALLAERGIAVHKFDRMIKTVTRLARKYLPFRGQLAATCGYEHFTALVRRTCPCRSARDGRSASVLRRSVALACNGRGRTQGGGLRCLQGDESRRARLYRALHCDGDRDARFRFDEHISADVDSLAARRAVQCSRLGQILLVSMDRTRRLAACADGHPRLFSPWVPPRQSARCSPRFWRGARTIWPPRTARPTWRARSSPQPDRPLLTAPWRPHTHPPPKCPGGGIGRRTSFRY